MTTIPPSQQIVVPILGMHRSGTSLATRLLNLLGLDLGGPLQPPGPDNPTGFWEHRLFQNFNIQMLKSIGFNGDGFGSEFDLYKAFSVLETTPVGPDTMAYLEEALSNQFTGPCWGYKDPRTVLNYPVWQQVLNELGYRDIRPVIVSRSPAACMQSLRRRGDAAQVIRPQGMPLEATLLNIWRAYTRILLQQMDLDQCLVLSQEDLLNPELSAIELQRMADWIGRPNANLSKAIDWIQPSLDHRNEDLPIALDPELQRLDSVLRSTAQQQRNRSQQRPLPAVPPAVERPPDWCIYVVSPTRYGHSEAFSEIALCLHHGFSKLGIDAPIVRDSWDCTGTPIVLGANLWPEYPQRNPLPDSAILYNLEQVEAGSQMFSPAYVELLKRHRVWDYSPKNIEQLGQWGIPNAQLCEIGFVPELMRIPDRPQDIDVLFYGSLNGRRRKVLNQLSEQGANIKVLQGLYGPQRDVWIARSKIVLNIHYYEAKVLEIVRLSYLLSNGRFVISEKGKDADLEAPFAQGMVLDAYDMLVPQCLTWLQHASARRAIAMEGQRVFTQRSQAEFLRPLITATTP